MPPRILIAEDDEVQGSLMRSALESRGYQAEIVTDGLEAVRRLRTGHYDVALLDYYMPEVDGLAAARLLHDSFPEDTRPRLIAITAAAEGLCDRENICGHSSFDAVVSKRVGLGRLLAVVDENLASAATLHAYARLERSARRARDDASIRRRRARAPLAALPGLAVAGVFLAAYIWAAVSLTAATVAVDANGRAGSLGRETASLVDAVQDAEASGRLFLATGLLADHAQFDVDAQRIDRLLVSSAPVSADGSPGFAGASGPASVQTRLQSLSHAVQSRTPLEGEAGAALEPVEAGRDAVESVRNWAATLVSGSQAAVLAGLDTVRDNVKLMLWALALGVAYGLWNAVRAVQRRLRDAVAAPGQTIALDWNTGPPIASKASRSGGALLLHDC